MLSALPLNAIMSYPPIVQILYFILCLLIGIAGINRKMGFWGYLFGSILLSPIVGLMLLLVSEKTKTEKDN